MRKYYCFLPIIPLILVELSLMSVLGDLAGKFDSDNLKVLMSKDTDKDVNNERNIYRDQDIPLNNMEAMLLSDDGFIKGKVHGLHVQYFIYHKI